ncbi:MAG: type II toxin-antitoxin system RelE/ParE family toxin [Thermosynechococcaceae cyanobacterium]
MKSVRHKGLNTFFLVGKTSGIQSKHVKRLRLQLAILDTAQVIDDVDRPGFKLHRLKGKMKDRWTISVSGNWRLTFEFIEGDVYVLD